MFSNVRTLDRRHRHRAAVGMENVQEISKTFAEYVLEELKKIAKKIGTMQEDLAATHTESWEVVEKAKAQEDLKKFIEGVRTVQDTVAAVHTQCEGRGEEMGVLLRTFVEIGQSSVDIMSSSHDTMLSMHAKERENPRENLRNILQEEKREKAKLARVDRRSRILKIKMHNMQKASEVMEGRQVLLEPIMVLQHQRRALRARHVHWVRVQWDPLDDSTKTWEDAKKLTLHYPHLFEGFQE